ncbi:MAG: transposase, partial [Gammaproteobacteria bacterium]|nr:transposase [Gammaproteobacteria bacterium]
AASERIGLAGGAKQPESGTAADAASERTGLAGGAKQPESGTAADAASEWTGPADGANQPEPENKKDSADTKPAADGKDKNKGAGQAETRPPAHRPEQKLLYRLIARHCVAPPAARPFHLFVLDCTSVLRPFAQTLPDRGIVHAPNPAPGNNPIGAGHEYSALVWLPEKTGHAPPWVVPLSIARVPFPEKGHVFGMRQLSEMLNDEEFDFDSQLCVTVGDTAYSANECRRAAAEHDSLVFIARLRGNRAVYRQPGPGEAGSGRSGGHPTWYGKKMKLDDESSLDPPDSSSQTEFITKKGRNCTVLLDSWNDVMFTGKDGFASHKHPFTLIRVRVIDKEGRKVFKKDMWLMVQGKRRHEVTSLMVYGSYRQRFDVEHFFRFGKQRLLTDKSQTPETTREEAWVQMTALAYVQLYLSRNIAGRLPYPWERYLPEHAAQSSGPVSPSQAQRDFARIAELAGTPAEAPQPRGASPGRSKGEYQPKRPRRPVRYKNAAGNAAGAGAAGKKEVTPGFGKQGDSPKPVSYSLILETLQGLLSGIHMSLEEFIAKTRIEVPP